MICALVQVDAATNRAATRVFEKKDCASFIVHKARPVAVGFFPLIGEEGEKKQAKLHQTLLKAWLQRSTQGKRRAVSCTTANQVANAAAQLGACFPFHANMTWRGGEKRPGMKRERKAKLGCW